VAVHARQAFLKANLVRRLVVLFGQRGGDGLAQGAGGQPGGVAGDERLARGGRGAAVGRQVGVGEQHLHAVVGQAQFLGGAHRHDAHQPLPNFGGAGAHLGSAVGK